MESFNRTLNNGQQETSFGKGLVFAILGMLLGVTVCVVVINLFDLIWWWAFGVIIGGGISGGWALGKGSNGASRQLIVIILSIIGGLAGLILGYALSIYNAGFGQNFGTALDFTIDWFLDEFFSDFFFDAVLIIGIAIATAWRRFDKNDILGESDDNDLEVLDNKSTRTEMEELLGEDIPTLRLDETWKCHACAAENRNIVNSCEYCGANK